MKFPGDLDDDERQQAFVTLREQSVTKWGEQRTTAIEQSLEDASASITRLDRLRFSRDDSPGFYLHETAQHENVPEQTP